MAVHPRRRPVCVCMRVRACVRACVCVCARACVYVCVCVYLGYSAVVCIVRSRMRSAMLALLLVAR